MKIKKNFNNLLDFIIKKIDFDIKSFYEKTDKTVVFDVWELEYFVLSLKKIQHILLYESTNFSWDTKPSLEFEKLGELIAKIEDIYDERYTYYIKTNIPILKNKFPTKTISIAHSKPSFKEYIKKLKIKDPGKADAENTVIDFDTCKTYRLNIHTTSDYYTKTGQGNLFLYNLKFDVCNIKNIYIINKLISKKHQGKLFNISNSDNLSIFNLLPFLSMLSKICYQQSNTSANQNFFSFITTPVITVGDEYWIEYNLKIAHIFSDKLNIEDWFYNFYSLKTISSTQIIKIFDLLLILILDMTHLIKYEEIKHGLQKNEVICLEQLFDLINSFLYLSEELHYFISKEDNEKLHYFINQIKQKSKKMSGFNLSNISYQKKTNTRKFSELCNQIHTLKFENFSTTFHHDILNNFLDEMKIYFQVNNTKQSIIESIKKIYPTVSEKHIEKFSLYDNYPNWRPLYDNVKSEHHLLFFQLFILLIEENNIIDILNEFDNKNDYGFLSYSLDYYRKRIPPEQIKVLFICEILYPYLNPKKHIPLLKIIYKYINYIIISDLFSVDEIKDFPNITNKTYVYLELQELFLQSEINTFEFVEKICGFLGGLHIIDFFEFLTQNNGDQSLMDSLIWYLRHKFFYGAIIK